jgi:GAF domain-containing protein
MTNHAWDPKSAPLEIRQTLTDLLNTAVLLARADMGKIHLFDAAQHALKIVAHHGFTDELVEYFHGADSEDESVCSRALVSKTRVVIDDVSIDPFYLRHIQAVQKVGFSAVQCTPLVNDDGEIVGALVTHYKKPHRLSPEEVDALDQVARHVAAQLERLMQ